MTLSLKRDVMDELFGNTSYIPVGNVEGDEKQEGSVGDMFSNSVNVWE